jgi:hypothetical protein
MSVVRTLERRDDLRNGTHEKTTIVILKTTSWNRNRVPSGKAMIDPLLRTAFMLVFS